ncbi:fungal-specific transcription factor domain-containing protein [Aspergillus bertholletiae]|uniref:Fungal-specific transcription factor domain-containing protein n=1 Tax=Aspergillus bertholletiae TaxID=1226010 RepID=A0A5N7AVQ3_9EURO|nr:fungal-specific transcription factor domain-containing protein [Aspergillus bertholletiae]
MTVRSSVPMNRSTPTNKPQVTPPVDPNYGEEEAAPTILKGKRKSSASVKRESYQRLKTTRACDVCKEKKTRCSGTRPCARCHRLSLACEYETTYCRGLGPPPPPPLELVFDSQSDETSYGQLPGAPEPAHPAPLIDTDLSTADFQGAYLDLASGSSFINRVCQRLSKDKTPPPTGASSVSEGFCEPSDSPSVTKFGDKPYSSLYKLDFTLPPLDRALEMVATYFDSAMMTYRFLHRGHVEQWLRQIYQSNISVTNLPTDLMVGRCCIVYSVLAIGTLYERRAPESEVDYDEQSERWFALSKLMSSIESGAPQMETVQARLNQSLYLLASSRASECWFAFGTTVQFLTALNIHRKWPPTMVKEGKGTYIEQELRKRTFWSVYTLDKYLSVMFGRPRLLHDEDFDQELPDEVTDQDLLINEPSMRSGLPDDMMTASVLHYRLSRVLADISRKLYTVDPPGGCPFEAAILLTIELERWKEAAAPVMDRRRSQIPQLAYSHAMIHITRLFLLNDCKDIPQVSATTYVQKCITAAEEIMTIINGLASRKALIHGFWFAHYVCFCAITVVYIHIIKQHQASSTGDPSNKPVENSRQLQYLFSLAETCQQHLGKATSRSSSNRRYGIILEELRLEVHRQVVSSHRPSPQVETEDDGPKADGFLPPSFHPAPVTAVSPKLNILAFDPLPADLSYPHLLDESFKLYDTFAFSDISDTSAWWAPLGILNTDTVVSARRLQR